MNRLVALLGVVAMMTLACRDSAGPGAGATTGSIVITVSTQSLLYDRDADGYSLILGDGAARPVSDNAKLTIADLPEGDHVVRLEGLAPNCSVAGPNPVTVQVKSGNAAAINLTVSCIAKTGTIRVSTATSGSEQDKDGYQVVVGGVQRGLIEPNGSITVARVPEGQLLVSLDGVAGNCAVDGINPRTVTVVNGATLDVAFLVRCVAAGSLHVTTVTSGVNYDPDGYSIVLERAGFSGMATIQTNGTATLPGLWPGEYRLTIGDMAVECDAVMPNPRMVTVDAGTATPIIVAVTCEAPRQLAVVQEQGAQSEIVLISSSGTDRLQLTFDAAADRDPAWSPDGSRLAFSSSRDGDREIYVMSANGTNLARLTIVPGADYRPEWSPDGKRIAFVSERDGNAEIYAMEADGTNPVRLTNDVGYDSSPSWSPDGRKIAFDSNRQGGRSAIWVMKPDGSDASRLTTPDQRDFQPAWSSDGTLIAFSRAGPGFVLQNIFVMSADGSGLRPLTKDLESAGDPAWSSNGRKIAFTIYHYYGDPEVRFVSTEGVFYSSRSVLTATANPAWRP